MPVPLRTPYSKAEAKYNVITEFPKLGLHEAAASGNLGLVEYALDHGQPVNSVLDGVLPLHAACAGGHIQVVKLLIEHGADVNAPRLPRRYFNDRNRDASAPIVGTSGSTPLHFAAANGNTNVVTLLLLHGAQAERPDKYGVTPEMLARDNNWVQCAQVLREWVINKDRDLREREELLSKDGAGAASPSANVSHEHSMEPETPSTRRRLHVKHSIDTALNILKASSQADTSLRPQHHTHTSTSPPPSPFRPFGEYPFNPDANGSSCPLDSGWSRRPSLPQIQAPAPGEPPRRKATVPAPSPIQRRPRSAGTGADRPQEHDAAYLPYGRGGQGRKLATKISLLFKKGQHGDPSFEHQNAVHSAPTTHPAPTPASASTTTLPIASTSSLKGRSVPLDNSYDPSRLRNHASSDASIRPHKILPEVKPLQPPSASFLEFDNSGPPSPARPPPSPARPPLPSAVDLHNALAQHGRDRSKSNATNTSTLSSGDLSSPELSPPIYGSFPRPSVMRAHDTLRQRSGSASSRVLDMDENDSTDQLWGQNNINEDGKATVRPGILRAHHRTGSSGQSSTPLRALRFDSAPSGERNRKEPSLSGSPASVHTRLHPTASSSSLRNRTDVADSTRELSPPVSARRFHESSPDRFDEEDEEQDYGQQLPSSRLAPVIDEDGEELHPPSALLLRQRGLSVGSQPDTPLSPIYIQENGYDDHISSEFLSSALPPRLMAQNSVSVEHQLSVPDLDRRGRGDSLSSTSTADSGTMAQSSTTSGSTMDSGTSVFVLTPASDGNILLPSTAQVLVGEDHFKDGLSDSDQDRHKGHLNVPVPSRIQTQTSTRSTLNERRAHSPLDIDITLISSHAQAEALVERTRQDILDLASGQEKNLSTSTTMGPTPLSAKLAALGESLALERKLREQEKLGPASKENTSSVTPSPLRPVPQFDERSNVARNGVERQLSLETKVRPKTKAKPKDTRRPSTADGLTSRSISNSFFPGGEQPRHYASPSLSVSPPTLGPTSSSYDNREFFSAPHHRTNAPGTSPNSGQPPFEPLTAPPLLKTRIRKELDGDSLSRVSSAEGVETETECAGLSPPATPVNGRKKETGTRSSSAKKLTRMGFSATDQSQSVARSNQPAGKRFGGLKSIMQTLKGKS
ncbi:hypothetical protein DFP72DRAFT_1004154 [Ephemerocybe angulata]|uniref:Ankyrin n=1 Tax=Ephemerocybe angulata TaxID=980116 RepID=A0A8H6I957_9AGAR|nr:hypothetical protein DFP72DRAFT_1004154 [Tulosesus angulatus]